MRLWSGQAVKLKIGGIPLVSHGVLHKYHHKYHIEGRLKLQIGGTAAVIKRDDGGGQQGYKRITIMLAVISSEKYAPAVTFRPADIGGISGGY